MHPWIWLNEPQHSAAIQALTGITSTVAAIGAAVYAAGAYRAAKVQARAAEEQALIAKRQAEISREQYEEQRRDMEADRVRRLVDDKARERRLTAEENERRPRWEFHRMATTSMVPIEYRITNGGKTTALNVVFQDPNLGATVTRDFVIPESSLRITYAVGTPQPETYILTFSTVFGSRWSLRFDHGPDGWIEEELDVDRPYVREDVIER